MMSLGRAGSLYRLRMISVASRKGSLMPTPPPRTNNEGFSTREMLYTA